MIEWNDPEELYAVGRRFHPVWRKAAEMELKGDYYPLTEARGSKDDWYAMQFECGQTPVGPAGGFVQIIRNIGVDSPEITVKPYVAPECLDKVYRFELAFSDEVREIPGKELAENGFTDNVPARTGRLWFYTVNGAPEGAGR